jgi:predicted RecA/RadA family phage recombinase
MSEAALYHGDPLMVDHTPGSAVTAGDLVAIGGRCFIAHHDTPAGKLGALAAPSGRAVYDVRDIRVARGSSAIARGSRLYLWRNAAGAAFITTADRHNAGLEPDDDEPVADDPVVEVSHVLIGRAVSTPGAGQGALAGQKCGVYVQHMDH